MTENQLNIIQGQRKSGKTDFIKKLSSVLYGQCNIYFIGATHELSDNREMISNFHKFDFFNSSELNNQFIMDKVEETFQKGITDMLIIDDIDFLSQKVIDRILNINSTKVVTCSNDLWISDRNIPKDIHYLQLEFETLMYKNHKYSSGEFIKTIGREFRIDRILNHDKGR